MDAVRNMNEKLPVINLVGKWWTVIRLRTITLSVDCETQETMDIRIISDWKVIV